MGTPQDIVYLRLGAENQGRVMEALEERKADQVTGACVRKRKSREQVAGQAQGSTLSRAAGRPCLELLLAHPWLVERRPSQAKESWIKISATVSSVNRDQCLHLPMPL